MDKLQLRTLAKTHGCKLKSGYVKKADLINLINNENKVFFIKEIPYTPPFYLKRKIGDEHILIKVRLGKNIKKYEYNKKESFEIMMNDYSFSYYREKPYIFKFDDDILNLNHTPYLYDMEDGDIIDVF